MRGGHYARLHWSLTVLLLAAVASLRVIDPAPLAQFRAYIFDGYQKLAPRAFDPAAPVRIVDIDSDSLSRLGQWPWPRSVLASLIDKLRSAGAKVIALDLVLPEEDRLSPAAIARAYANVPEVAALTAALAQLPSNDDKLAAAISASPVAMGFIASNETRENPGTARASFAIAGDDPRAFVPRFNGAYGSLADLGAGAKGLGAVNWTPGADQIVRKMPTLVSIGGVLQPSLALETLRVASGEPTIFVRSSGGSGVKSFGQTTGVESVRIGKTVMWSDADGEVWMHFSPSDRRRYISAASVLESGFTESDVKDRIILIGSSAPGLLDLRATPLESAVPGVEIHAQALEQMLGGGLLQRPDYATGAELAFLSLGGLGMAWIIRRSGPLVAASIGLASMLGVGTASWLAFTRGGALIDPVFPSIALVVLYSAGTLLNYMRSESERLRVHATFSHYMAPSVIEQVARHPERLKLGGETRTISLLFADVRGFTRLSEGLNAEELTAFLNRLFTPVSDIIVSETGTIDKFIGDAVMAFWGAPLDDPEHAEKACRAALRLVAMMERLNRARREEALHANKDWQPLAMGIGLNTGACCAGNLGSPQRFDYSVIGEAVNVASRLEGLTKEVGVPILAGASVVAVAGKFAFLEIGSTRLRGKDKPERVYALIGDEAMAATQRFREFKTAFDAVVAATAAGNREAALLRLADCRNLSWPGLDAMIEAKARQLYGSVR